MNIDGSLSSLKCSGFVKTFRPHEDRDLYKSLSLINLGDGGSLHCPAEQVLSFLADAIYPRQAVEESGIGVLMPSMAEAVMLFWSVMEDL
jgi:hypothetical protein